MDTKRSLFLALIFQLSWVAVACVVLFTGGDFDAPLLVGMMIVLWVPAVVEYLLKTPFPDVIHIGFHTLITASSVGGSVFGLYAFIPHWDTIVHAYSGVMLAWLGFFAVKQAGLRVKRALPRWLTLVTGFAVTMTFAALWEISEYLSDMFLRTTTQPNLEDTIVDMMAALVGGLVAAACAAWFRAPLSVVSTTSPSRVE